MPVRGYLNERSVLAIFAKRPRPGSPVSSMCLALASEYRVSRKTIRDIWNRKSWLSVTSAVCDNADVASNPVVVESESESEQESSTTPSLKDPFAHFNVPVLDCNFDIYSDQGTNGVASNICHSDYDYYREPSAFPSLQDPFAHFTAAALHESISCSVASHFAAAAHHEASACSLEDDIEESACTSHQDPFGQEWECSITGIDLCTMVVADDIPATMHPSFSDADQDAAVQSQAVSPMQAPNLHESELQWDVEGEVTHADTEPWKAAENVFRFGTVERRITMVFS